MNYATLKSNIEAWSLRGDLTSLIPSFVSMAETEIFKTHNTPLRVREMETEVTLSVTSLAATVPSDFLEARYVKLDDSVQTTLLYKAPEIWNPNSSGSFTMVAGEIRLPNGSTSGVKLAYLAKPAALASDSDTNAVLENYYSVYYTASMKYASAYVKDAAAVAAYQGQLDTYMDSASRHGKPMTAGSLVVRSA